ncbi:histone-lysine N-methyltransferase SETMAR-like [Octopus bimaculoides]|uniref:histone-lysine N-methyltransferase SETMAR-like n=1 Tax=Octopus bimaculoides TaxID=37653 RepID=UPI00071D885B|nr:histone-lysine N-methyltransferase SETMAR-like [Octopus bimaculoides]|eukprot:XP_014790550.1 PREDICTED: histone-lysine N-methyltransferase SETMAR-like [Octopus bimaculoides]
MGLEVDDGDINNLIEEHSEKLMTDEHLQLQEQQHLDAVEEIGCLEEDSVAENAIFMILSQNRASLVNRKYVIFHHDNARPHTARLTKTLLEELGWEILPHPPYSPDLAPSDYHLFRGLQNHLDGLRLATREETENVLHS